MKRLAMGMLVSFVALGVVSGAYASMSNERSTATEVRVEKGQENVDTNGSIDIDATDAVVTIPLGSTQMLKDFNVKKGYGYMKVYVDNKGTKPINVTLTQKTDIGTVVELNGNKVNTIPAKTAVTLYNSKPTVVGAHYVSLTSGKASMVGTLAVRIGTDLKELKQ